MQINPEILNQWGIDSSHVTLSRFGSGHIHQTFLLTVQNTPAYILQKLNTDVFKAPEAISANIKAISDYLKKNHPEYPFPGAIATYSGSEPLEFNGEAWRLTSFIPNSYSPNELVNPSQAFEAAAAFGKLTRLLNSISLAGFRETIPGFHNLRDRFDQFKVALNQSSGERIAQAENEISFYLENEYLVNIFDEIRLNEFIPRRVQHHDTKINNVLFDKDSHRALAVCDLDTLMPGYFISDLGDMIRTYTSAENEESTNWDQIKVRPEFLQALKEGYLSQMEEFLTPAEKNYIPYSGEFMIYMQGIRFLSDFLNGDTYYPVSHELHNLFRTRNQMILLKDYRKYM